MSNQLAFGYQALDTETRIIVQQRTSEIKTLMRRTAQDIIDIGQKLIEVKARLGYGNFGAWLQAEFGWSDRTARQFMMVSEQFKSENFADLNFAPSALYLLASPSTPETARAEAIERANNGESITHGTAKQIVEAHKALAAAALDTDDPPALAINAAQEVLDEYEATGGYVTNYIGAQIEGTPDNLIDATQAAIIERQRRQAQHIQDKLSDRPGYDGNEWYTPADYVALVRQLLGAIDVDPASCEYAQQTVQAATYYTKADDGLAHEWIGRVFLNPPYSFPEVQQFTDKLIAEYESRNTDEAILLVNNCTDAAWFQRLLARYPVCFTAGRISFERPDAEQFATRQGQAFFYLGKQVQRFAEIFNVIGRVVRAV
jgi:phage N-6-adenine-methyltransferase